MFKTVAKEIAEFARSCFDGDGFPSRNNIPPEVRRIISSDQRGEFLSLATSRDGGTIEFEGKTYLIEPSFKPGALRARMPALDSAPQSWKE